MAHLLKRREAGNEAAKKAAAEALDAADAAFAKKHPALAEFLSLEEWEPGQARERGTITLFWEEGTFKACVSNRDSQEVAFVTKRTFAGLLEAIEKGLATDSLDWRGGQRKGSGKGRKA